MARAVVLYFPDNSAAEQFILELNTGAEMGEESLNKFCEATGLYPIPTVFCDSSDSAHKGKGKMGRGYTRGTKWGWWVCVSCRKPYRARSLETLVRATVSQAKNLLSDADPKALAQSGTKAGDL